MSVILGSGGLDNRVPIIAVSWVGGSGDPRKKCEEMGERERERERECREVLLLFAK